MGGLRAGVTPRNGRAATRGNILALPLGELSALALTERAALLPPTPNFSPHL